ncbi:MAG: xanthine dehydrogenase accessory factor [Parvicellaceae bacterium]|jgi:xanthine dehydrogenase accessory factor
MSFWNVLYQELSEGNSVALMYVHKSKGSSPGRQGFKMFVSQSGSFHGSIGGGVMEFNQVELCKTKLNEGKFQPFEKLLIHQSNIPEDQSGLICSGEQTVGFYFLDQESKPSISKLMDIPNQQSQVLCLSNLGLSITRALAPLKDRYSYMSHEEEWKLEEHLGHFAELHIMGAGHVGLALSQLGHRLDFEVHVYDNRLELNTLPNSADATFHFIENYGDLKNHINSGQNKYVVIMSYGFITDLEILKQLVIKEFKYLGLMGSKEKVKRLNTALLEQGVEQHKIDQIYAPIGVQIASKTPMEIAVSIMAQIIQIKNE